MPEYEKISGPTESERAPPGVCEITVQIVTDRAFDIQGPFEDRLKSYVSQQIETTAFETKADGMSDTLVVYTGTDRLSISELRDIAEAYGMFIGYEDGNIPQNMNLMATTPDGMESTPHIWLQFKLERELPTKQVRQALRSQIGEVDLEPRNPKGEEAEAILFREGNYAYHQVRELLVKTNSIIDTLPVDNIQLVCEMTPSGIE